MNASKPILDHTQARLGLSKLALMGLCIAILTAAIAVHLPARADGVSANVSLAGLNLGTAGGMQTARTRVQQTARHLCARLVSPWGLAPHDDLLRCIDETTAAALAKLDEHALVANAAR